MPGNFKVIVVGGGPIGLSAAQALHLAGIDFVVLEKRTDLCEDLGAALVMGPNSLRVLHQFGILESLRTICSELDETKSFEAGGRLFARNTQFQEMRKNHGATATAFHRAEFLKVLYHDLSHGARARILTGKKVVDIALTGDGVSVTSADGEVYAGSVVIGADGVHSQTRRLMRGLALSEEPTREWDSEDPFQAEYNCLWCSVPLKTTPRTNTDTQDHDRSVMYIPGKNRGWLFMYERLPRKTSERMWYTEKDVAQQAAKFADFPITESHKVGDVFTFETAGMANVEEGIAKNWSYRRVVLVGDACHKFTPNAGLGFQNGLQDVVALCNGLSRALRSSPDGTLSEGILEGVIDEYKEARKDPVKDDAARSAAVVRLQTWANWIYYFFARHVLSWSFVPILIANRSVAPRIAGSLVLDYVAVDEPFTGSVEWVHPMPKSSSLEEDVKAS